MAIDERLIAELKRALPADGLLTRAAETAEYECDALTMFKQTPAAVALPQTAAQVAETLALCKRHNTPVVARGAGTGLSGGALPRQDGVLLSTARLNNILQIDARARVARVQPGVINLDVSKAAATHGLYYAPDPSSQSACSIGGNIAENSGGVHCLKYGLTVHNVLRMQVATIDGDLVEVGEETPGYDLAALLVGSEGMLGVATEATLKLLPRPPQTEVLLAAFANLQHCADAVASIISAGIVPAGLEMMDNPAICATEAFVGAGYPTDAAAILLCELDGDAAELSRALAQTKSILQKRGATEVRQAANADERAKFWAGRKAAFPAVGRISPDYYCMDGTIPRKRVAEVLGKISELSAAYGLGVANVFHAGDGNLHPLIFYDSGDAESMERAERFGNDILRACVAAGGTVTGEHGVGVEKLDAMCSQFSPAELQQFFRLKAAFDEKTLLNPGKAIPTLSRCSEVGGMHVHGGKLPRPDLERF